MLVELRSGALKASESALVSLIIPVAWLGSDQNGRAQFDQGNKGSYFASQRWPSLVILPKGCRVRRAKCDLVFYMVMFFQHGSGQRAMGI